MKSIHLFVVVIGLFLIGMLTGCKNLTPMEEFEAVIGKMIAMRLKGQTNIMETRSKMKDAMTKEEWVQIFSSKK